MELKLIHITLIFKNSLFALCDNVRIGCAYGHLAVKILLSVIEAGTYSSVEHVRKQEAFLYNRIVVLRLCIGVIGLGLEADAPCAESQSEPVHTELFGCIVVQQIRRHRRLYRAAAACFLVKEQNVVVCNEDRKLHFAVLRVGGYLALFQRHEHCHFRNTVEVDVIRADKLIYL